MLSTHAVLAEHDMATDLVADLEVPVIAGMQRQGDVLVVPTKPGKGESGKGESRPVPADGVPVVRSVAGGNTHQLIAVSGPVMWRATPNAGSNVGVVTVPDGSVAGLAHPEHGLNLIGPGTYVARRQREMRDEVRLVAD